MPSPIFPLPRPSKPLQRAVVVALATAGLFVLSGCPQKEALVVSADAQADEAAVAVATAEAVAPAAPPAPPAPRPTASATLKRAELMALVFPDSQGPGAAPRQPDTVSLPERANEGKTVPGSEAEQQAHVSPREVVRLDDTHAVMLTETVPLDDRGQPMNGHVNGAWLGAYFFEQGADGWKLASRNDAVDYLGFMGNLGTTKVERIAPQRFALTIAHGSCWQGYCGQWLSVYGLEAGQVRVLASGIPLSATNAGVHESCEKVRDAGKPDEPPPSGGCFDIGGTPTFALGTDDAPGEMRIAFKGERMAGGKSRRVSTIDSTLVYAWRKGAYVLTEGRNPVPSF
ncbi:hypothetical protein QFZ83_003408 [Variovorax sp. W1I1]|uniref:hypothetical protein n=1 Tax=Variovorax sp. W1I1 TaxID=3042309 RepID=UPI0027842F9E|nr:hypothetical protein [Variovorax sp. W1I1]MDQ0609237.1 hypothetical protein [Variovorax sp. W1I1]